MKVEMHLHTSRHSAHCRHTPEELIERLIATGYHAVYLTAHDEVWSDEELRALRRRYPQIRIFPGLEKTLGDQHLLVLGANDPAYLELDDPVKLLAKAGVDGHLTVLAHPYRQAGGATMLKQGLLPDAIEYRTTEQDEQAGEATLGATVILGLPVVNAGDVHDTDCIDRFWIETKRPFHHADDIRNVVLTGAYSVRVRQPVHSPVGA